MDESIILQKAIDNAKANANMFGYNSLSDNEKDLINYDRNNMQQKALDAALSFGPAAIQKLGSGQVYGKLAKAVRKMLTRINTTTDTDIAKKPLEAIFNMKWIDDTTGKKVFEKNVGSVVNTDLNKLYNADAVFKFSNKADNIMAVIPSESIGRKGYWQSHELGHVLERYNKYINKAEDMGFDYWGKYEQLPNEVLAESFAANSLLNRGKHPIDFSSNPELTKNALKFLDQNKSIFK